MSRRYYPPRTIHIFALGFFVYIISMWLYDAEDKNENIPEPSDLSSFQLSSAGFISLIDVDTIEYRRQNDSRAVKKTLTIPSWLNVKAEKAGINFSQVLQNALKEELDL